VVRRIDEAPPAGRNGVLVLVVIVAWVFKTGYRLKK